MFALTIRCDPRLDNELIIPIKLIKFNVNVTGGIQHRHSTLIIIHFQGLQLHHLGGKGKQPISGLMRLILDLLKVDSIEAKKGV